MSGPTPADPTKSPLGWWGSVGLGLQDFVAPYRCDICNRDSAGSPFCPTCREEVLKGSDDPACPRCASRVGPYASLEGGCSECRGRGLGFRSAIALGPYEGRLRELCLKLKNKSESRLARGLVELLVDTKGCLLRDAAGENAIVSPIPLHWVRKLRRGYNQAEALAEHLADRLGFRLRPGLLRRVRATAPLAGASRAERAVRMKDAFRANPWASIKGKTVLLVDDILTTGATCGAAGKALRKAGAAKTVAVVIGRAGSR